MSEPTRTKRGSTRSKGRKRALDVLFEADLRELPVVDVLAAATERNEPPVRPFTIELVNGVVANREELDELISARLPHGWSLDRMPRVDRNLARLAAFELVHSTTADTVVLAEYVNLATELSTDESPSFLNGVLGALARGVHEVG